MGNVSGLVGYRALWLAQSQDALPAAGLRDTSGDSGSFVGNQLEIRLRIQARKDKQIELGAALLDKGGFMRSAPSAPDTGDTRYFYSQFSYQF